MSALWSDKWRAPCAAGIFPFADAKVEDLDPIFAELSKVSTDDPAILHRPDDYAKPFFPAARQLIADVERAASKGGAAEARAGFCGAAVYRIARFPINRSALSKVRTARTHRKRAASCSSRRACLFISDSRAVAQNWAFRARCHRGESALDWRSYRQR